MKEWAYILSDFAATGISILLYFYFLGTLLKADLDKKNQLRIIMSGILLAAVLTVVASFSPLPTVWLIAIEVGTISSLSWKVFQKELRLCLFIAIFYEIAVALGEFLFANGIKLAMHSAYPDVAAQLSETIAVWVLRVLLLALAFIVWKKKLNSAGSIYRLVSAISLVAFLTLIALSQQSIIQIEDDALTTWLILSIILMVSVLVFNMNRTTQMERDLSRMRAEQAQLLERNYTALNQAYSLNARTFHDFHNHIGVMSQMLSHGKSEETLRYLSDLQVPAAEFATVVWTGDETTDYLINSKAAEAAKLSIKLECNIEFPRNTNIRAADMSAILGNFLDNALAACQRLPEDSRFMRVAIRRINDMLVIKVENSFSGIPIETESGLTTTKTDDGFHGWGLKSAKIAADKYDGIIKTDYSDGTFRAVATLSFDKVRAPESK